MIPSRSLARGTAAGILLIVLSLFGCAGLDVASKPPVESPEAPLADGVDPAAGPVYGIEFISLAGKTERKRVPLPPQPMFVQQALEQTGALQRFGSCTVTLMRLPGPDQPPLRMNIPIENGRVDVLKDYALHPGDRLTIVETGKKGIFR